MYVSSLAALTALAMIALDPCNAIAQTKIELRSRFLTPPVALQTKDTVFHQIRILGEIDAQGNGRGVLILDPNTPTFDDFGSELNLENSKPQVRLAVEIEFERSGRSTITRVGLPPAKWHRYRISGDHLKAAIAVDAQNQDLRKGRLLIFDDRGKVQSVVALENPFPTPSDRPLPCHPGCFPAGTMVATPDGEQRIEDLQPGTKVVTLDREGEISVRPVKEIFRVKNVVLKLQTEDGPLVTTETQPLPLVDGTTKGAGELSNDDMILRWKGGKLQGTEVVSIQRQFRVTRVHNLVFDETTFFVANGFVVRSKPPAVPEPAQ
ncbi:MAG: hypothetical protein GY904_25805 [Planctomycetaceae bacterium]|nr:hypothetical protein [Planctomycetaceae bacterium]